MSRRLVQDADAAPSYVRVSEKQQGFQFQIRHLFQLKVAIETTVSV
jgi:hypothetical protein